MAKKKTNKTNKGKSKNKLVALWTTKKELQILVDNMEDNEKRTFLPLMKTTQPGKKIVDLFPNDVVKIDFNRIMDDSCGLNNTKIVKEGKGYKVVKE